MQIILDILIAFMDIRLFIEFPPEISAFGCVHEIPFLMFFPFNVSLEMCQVHGPLDSNKSSLMSKQTL